MNKEILENQLTFAEARVKALEEQVKTTPADQKGYKELVDGYNKWCDTYNGILEKLEHVDDDDIEILKLNLDRERLNFDKEKFERQMEHDEKHETFEEVLEALGLTAKVAIPILGITGAMAIANLAYTKDLNLDLCNGRIFPIAKEILKLGLHV